MYSTSSWPSRLVLALLALQLASACKPDPTPPPPGNPDTTPPSTRANPQGGNFTASLTVTLTCDDGTGSGCAATYYTADGTAPTTSSQRYTSPVALSRNTTLKFFSVDTAGNAEAPQTQSYVVDQVSPLTVASPAGGIINSARSVALLCTDSDGTGSGCAATHYTTDGTAPTASSPRYTAPLLVSASTTLRFFSVDVVGNTEAAKTEQYTLDATAPTVVATPAAGSYATAQTVTLSCDDGAGTGCGPIHYTTDGSVPMESALAYTAPLLVSANTTLRFRAVDGAGNASPVVSAVYLIDEAGPATTATPPGALYNTPVSVVLSCDDGAGGIGCAGTYYTTDGSPPTTGSARYTTALPITSSTPLKFFSVDKLGNPGPTGTAQYTLDFTAPVTTANPPGGTYSGARTVVLECKDGTGAGCAATYYTLDGTTPTRGSSRYTTPLHITANTVLRFFSVDKANNTESVRTEEYDLDSVAPSTQATPAGGLYKSNQSVVLSCDDGLGSGCVETHYTVDGSMPTMASPKYTSALLLTGNTTLRFFSVDVAGNQEAVQTETYTIDTVAPSTTANPAAGTYGSTVSVTLACDDGASGSGCAGTHYTVDGSAPTTSSPLYSSALSLSATTTLRYFSTDKAGNREPTRVALYTLDLVAPAVSASPKGGLYNKAQSITLTCSDTGGSTCAAIHYTTDGTEPTTASATYSAPLPLSATTPLKFLAVDKVGNASDVQTETYRIDVVPPTTTATPPGGPYADSQSVTLQCGDGAGSGCSATYYTTDGSTPTSSSSPYSAPFTLTATTALKFFSVDAAGNAEPVKTVTYVIDRDKPTVAADPPGGTYRVAQSVTLACTDTGGSGCASIHYTIDGSPPTTGSATYSAALTVSANTTLRFLAVDKVGNTSAAQTVAYVIDTVAPTSTATPVGGTYLTAKNITLNCVDNAGGSGCAATYYTTDGSLPSTGSRLYTGPFSLSANTTLRFFSVDAAGNSEPAKTETYTFELDTVPPTTTAAPPAGTYGGTVSVTLACNDGAGIGCAETRYTVDGTTPGSSSPLYSGAISITSTTTLRYASKDMADNLESVRVAAYLIDRVAPAVSASVKGGTYRTAQTVALTCSDTGGSTCDSIHYTLDGSTPSLASLTYSVPLTVSANTTLKFLAVDKVGNASGASTESYVIDTVAPVTTAIRAGGAYGSAQSVTLLCADGSGSGCSATYFTLDGSTPTTGSSRYASPISITANATLRFFSVDGAGNAESPKTEAYVIDTESPTVSVDPVSGLYNSAQRVTLSCTDNPGGSGCAAIHYTTDGSSPTMSSPLYTEPITVSASTMLGFFAVDTVGNVSATQYASYLIDTVAPVTVAYPPGGTYTTDVYVYLDCRDDTGSACAAIHYTTDGSTPTRSSPVTFGYFYFSATTTLKFFSVDVAGNAEPVHTETYVINPDTQPPTTYASPPGGTYTSAQYVYLSCSDNTWCGSTYYTLDGSEPTTASPRYPGYLYISSTTTLKFFSVDGYGNAEPVHTETYSFAPDTTPPTTYVSPAGGTYSSAQVVYLSCSDDTWCDSTYYTLDGSEPTTASPRYYGYLYISSTTMLKFFSVDGAGNTEPVRTETYSFGPDTTPPTTYVYPTGGTYSSAQYVTLSCVDNTWCDSTYYTLDGSEPTTASPRYPGYFYISSTTTLKFFSVDGAGNAEPVRTENYVIESPPTDPWAQIARIRSLPDGTLYEPINGALVTYTKATTGLSDPAGFFIQGSASGPALFVAIDPLTLSPTPQPGDRVYLYATYKATVNGLVQLTQIDTGRYTVYSGGESVEPFRRDVSSSDLVLEVGNYESTLISFSGTVASDFASAGTGHVSANVVSLGNPTVSSSLKLRLTASVQSALDVTQGCSVTTNAPLWRFNTQAQPSAWTSADLTVLSCPAPRVLGASSTSGTAVVVAFDRRIDPATVSASGSQFTFDNGLVATSATVTDRQVQLTTSSQVEGTSYRVTVAPSILDTRGSAIDGSANSASFTGYTSTPTPGIAQLRISEVSPGILNGRDLVELIAIRGGSVDGFSLTMGATVMATFPNVQVAAGDVIVVHIKPDATNGDAAGSETTSKSEFPAGTYSANYDTAWDFLGSTANEIGYSRRVLRVRDATGAMQDGAAFGRTGGTPPGDFLGQLKQLQDEGAWLPVNCGGNPCSDATIPTALDVSVDWAGCGTTRSGSSVRRVSAADNDVRTDWAVGTSSFGLANP